MYLSLVLTVFASNPTTLFSSIWTNVNVRQVLFILFLGAIIYLFVLIAQGKQYIMCRGVHPVRIDLLALDVTLNDQSTIPYEQITLQEQLGEGSFATVHKVNFA